jgi:hypothetical protein
MKDVIREKMISRVHRNDLLSKSLEIPEDKNLSHYVEQSPKMQIN